MTPAVITPGRVLTVPTSRRPLVLLLTATLAAGIGSGISFVVFPWLVLQHSGSALDAGAVAVAAALPLLLSSVTSGIAVDSLGGRRVSIISGTLSALTVLAVPVLALTAGPRAIDMTVLAVLVALCALFSPAGITARQSMLPEAATTAGWSLDRTNGAYQLTLTTACLAGPGLGGLLIALVGGVDTMCIAATAFAVSVTAMTAVRRHGRVAPSANPRPGTGCPGLLAGFRYSWNLPLLRTLAVIDVAMTALYLPLDGVLYPKYFADHDQPAQLGSVLMAMAVGSTAGALAYPSLLRYLSRRLILLNALLTVGTCTALVSLLPPLVVLLILSALIGFACGPIGPIFNTAMHTAAPPHLRGRVIGAMTSAPYAAGPIGSMVAGALADTFGLSTTLRTLALPMLAIGIAAVFSAALKQLDTAQA